MHFWRATERVGAFFVHFRHPIIHIFLLADSVDLSKYSPEVVLGAYKQFVLDLPEPLMTFDLFLSFTAASGTWYYFV